MNTAMILAAGRGERLRPITDTIPKPLVQVGHCSLISHHLTALANAGYSKVIINVSYLGDLIEQAVGDGAQYGLDVQYSRESEGALETAGGIRNALDLIAAEEFLVVNGDIRCNVDFSALILPKSVDMHLVMVENPPHHPDGDFAVIAEPDGINLLQPATAECSYTFSGIGLYRADLFRQLPEGINRLAPVINQAIDVARASGEIHRGRWHDVGSLDRLEAARATEISASA